MAAAAPGDLVAAPAPTRKLQIVVDDGPAPIGTPIEVLSGVLAKPAPVAPPAPPREREPEPQAPVRLPQGLMRVLSTTPPDPAPPPIAAPRRVVAKAKPAEPPVHLAAARLASVHVAPVRVAPVRVAKAAQPKAQKIALARAAEARAQASKAAKAEAHRIELAEAAKAEATRIELAKAARAEAHRIELAKAAKAEAHRIELAKAAKAAKAEKQQQIRLAKAEAKGRAEARAEAKAEALAQAQEESRRRIRLASLAAARAAPHAASHGAKAPPAVELARLDRKPGHKVRHELRVERASARKPLRAVEPSYRARAAQPTPQPPSGLMKVSTSPHCANRDPGAGPGCVDPALGAAERQLARAYQGARAAGVPDAQLQREQQHWLASRSAAAREAPWAVHDVYLARIAELNGMAKDAHGDGR